MHMIKAIIFDMDGTVLNTLTDLTICTNYALEQLGYAHDFPADRVKLCYGAGIIADMEKSIAMAKGCTDEDLEFVGNEIPLSHFGFGEKEVLALRDVFSPYYADHSGDHSAPYEGIVDLLKELRNRKIKTAIASNKDESDVVALAEKLFPQLFDRIIGNSPKRNRKPAPDMINDIADEWNLSKEEILYVGDSEVDLETAINANVKFLAVPWGFRTEKFLKDHGAETIIQKAEEILEYV